MGHLGHIKNWTFRTYTITNSFYFLPTLLFRIKDIMELDGRTVVPDWKVHCFELCLFNYSISCEKMKKTKD